MYNPQIPHLFYIVSQDVGLLILIPIDYQLLKVTYLNNLLIDTLKLTISINHI